MTSSVDLAGVHVGGEIAKRLELIDRLGFDRIGVDDRLADVAERLVHRVRERVDARRLAVAGDDETGAAMRLKILGDSGDPLQNGRLEGLCDSPGGARSLERPGCADRGDSSSDGFDLAWPAAAADDRRARRSTSACSRSRTAGSCDRRLFGAAARGEIARVAEAAGPQAEEVGVEREDHVGALESVLRVDVFAEGELRAGARVVAARGIPLMPLRRREAR